MPFEKFIPPARHYGGGAFVTVYRNGTSQTVLRLSRKTRELLGDHVMLFVDRQAEMIGFDKSTGDSKAAIRIPKSGYISANSLFSAMDWDPAGWAGRKPLVEVKHNGSTIWAISRNGGAS